jgi:hypothetical protein
MMLLTVAILCTFLFGRVTSGPLYFLAIFPGVLLHELAHFLVATVLYGEPGPIRLFPKKRADETWELGSVTFSPSWWNAGFVALAPLYVLPVVAWVVFREFHTGSIQDVCMGGYLLACIGRGSVPSGADWDIAFRWPLGTLVVLGGLCYAASVVASEVFSQSFF